MAKAFAVDFHFTNGVWSFHPGEVLSEEDLAARGLPADPLPIHGRIREVTSLAELEPAAGRANFDGAAMLRAAELLGVSQPDAGPEPAEDNADTD
jgi:hypothetical protein